MVVAVGVFAIGEALWTAAHLRRKPLDVIPVGRPFMGRDDWRRSWGPWLRGTALGFPFGAVPAGGAETPTFLSYITERKLAARKGGTDEFGEGAIEGVAGPEAANNASAAGMFVPLLALGLPVTATASILLAALHVVRHRARAHADDRPAGPDLDAAGQPADRQRPAARDQPPAGPGVGQAPAASRGRSSTPGSCSSPRSAPTASTRTRSTSACCWPSAAVGFAIRRFGIPVLPLILGVILGPLMEVKMREALDLSGGDLSGLFSEGLAIFVYVLVVLALVVPIVLGRLRRTPQDAVGAVDAADDQEEVTR